MLIIYNMKNYSKNRICVTFEPYDLERMKKYTDDKKQFTSQSALVRHATLRFLDYLENSYIIYEKKDDDKD